MKKIKEKKRREDKIRSLLHLFLKTNNKNRSIIYIYEATNNDFYKRRKKNKESCNKGETKNKEMFRKKAKSAE